jgi:hypothetical protein
MEINLDTPAWVQAAERFCQPATVTVEVRFQMPRDHVIVPGDFSCESFVLHVAELGAESDQLIRVFKAEAERTHPAIV